MSLSSLYPPSPTDEPTLKSRVLGELTKREDTLQGFHWKIFLLKDASLVGDQVPMHNAYGRSAYFGQMKLLLGPIEGADLFDLSIKIVTSLLSDFIMNGSFTQGSIVRVFRRPSL